MNIICTQIFLILILLLYTHVNIGKNTPTTKFQHQPRPISFPSINLIPIRMLCYVAIDMKLICVKQKLILHN